MNNEGDKSTCLTLNKKSDHMSFIDTFTYLERCVFLMPIFIKTT
jgi:hypothetical protein